MEIELYHWFLNGCYLLGGISIGYWFAQWRNKRPVRTGSGRWDFSNKRFLGEGDQ
jgi:glycerol-3-phosphate acyltransferase PlsY